VELPGSVGAALQSASTLLAGKMAHEVDRGSQRVARDVQVEALPAGQLIECICSGPSAGGHLLLSGQLAVCRQRKQYCALIDVADAFDPAELDEQLCEHVLWVRCEHAGQGLKALDIVLRDDNFACVVADLRCQESSQLLRFPLQQWYRLQRLVHQRSAVFFMLTYTGLCPAADVRVQLEEPFSLAALDTDREQLQKTVWTRVRAQIAHDRK